MKYVRKYKTNSNKLLQNICIEAAHIHIMYISHNLRVTINYISTINKQDLCTSTRNSQA